MTEIFEHTVDMDLLPEKALILDLGCFGMEFTNYFRELGHTVHAVDIQELDGDYHRCAITDYNGFCDIVTSDDPQSTKIKAIWSAPKIDTEKYIPCCTLDMYMTMKNVNMYDLIKMDIEGSEYGVIMSLTKAPAKQISLEMHLHTGTYLMGEVIEMEIKLESLGYKNVYRDYSDKHCAGKNIWDSLWVL